MDGPALADSIDTSDPLLETRRVPWQLVVHDEATLAVQVQPFRGGIGGQQQSAVLVELRRHARALARGQAALRVPRGRRPRREVDQRVAVLGEDDDGFTR